VKHVVDVEGVRDLLGRPRVHPEHALAESEVGIATGMYYTPMGGDIMFVEASIRRYYGKPDGDGSATLGPNGAVSLILTGQLGDVMKESAHAALSYVRTNAEKYGLAKDFLEKSDIHVHIPAGAMPKDGPSAGITMFTAIVSLLTGIRVRHDVAMTGEISLRGRVLPIGGLKEKTLAAHRAGIKRVLVPERNKADLDEVPKEVRDELEFVFVSKVDEVLQSALESMPQPSQSYLDEVAKAQAQPSSN
jgi:ATP-dependent Lon protease